MAAGHAVIPEDWWVHPRGGDGEVVGYGRPSTEADGLVVPLSLIGTPLGPPQAPDRVADLLDRVGLAVLAGRWWSRLPTPIPETGCDPTERRVSWDWRAVVIVEARSARCIVRPGFPLLKERTRTVALPVPVGDLLAADPPA